MCLLSGRVAASSLIMPRRTRSARLMGSLDYGRSSHTTISGLRISSMCLLQRSSRGLRGWSFSSLGAKIYVYMTEGEDKRSISGPLSESPLFSRFILTLLTISPYISQLLSLPAQYFTSDGVLEPISLLFLHLYTCCVLFCSPKASRLDCCLLWLATTAFIIIIITSLEATRDESESEGHGTGKAKIRIATAQRGYQGLVSVFCFKFSSTPFGFFIYLAVRYGLLFCCELIKLPLPRLEVSSFWELLGLGT